ncbi:CynX/NimT family MFS transporter [Microlunatus ginsengisoli]|uniref:CynX/NimT family MFS transporter n=1 Tax=Microlunatus ginsengisoli TaxID=363863 RepID=A0ABP6ZUU8_9ACTN
MTATTESARDAAHAGRTATRLGAALTAVVVVAIGLTAFNLRPAVTSVGPLLAEVRAGLGMSGAVAGLLTAFPALCFVVFGTFAPRLVRRLGPALVLCLAAATVAVGLALRPYVGGGTGGFIALSAVALGAIGVANVVMPVAVKKYFPHRVGTMTGFYSMGLTLGASLAAAVTVPLTGALGGHWQAGLAVWAIPALLAALAWTPLLRRDRPRREAQDATERAAGQPHGPAVRRSRTAWALAVFFGLQSSGAYMVMGWLPQIFRDAGFSAETAGLLLAATPAIGIPLSFLLPTVAGRMRSQGGLVVALSAIGVVAYAGIGLAPAAAPWLWVLLLGVSQSTFPLALTMIGLRARTPSGVVKLSTFAQGIGYLLSVGAPILVGVLYERTHGWLLPTAFMAALLVPQAVTGYLAGRQRFVEDELAS